MRTLATAEDPPFNRAQDYRHIINECVRSSWVEELIVMQPNGLGRFIEVQKLITIVLGGAAKPYIGLRIRSSELLLQAGRQRFDGHRAPQAGWWGIEFR